jgi:cell shape-determining protein MreC
LFAIALSVLAWISLRPDPRLEGALDLALSPTRVLAELTVPVRWLARKQVRAAERRLQGLQEAEHQASQALYEAERRMALPTRPELLSGRSFVHARVVGRPRDNLDRLLVQLQPGSGRVVQTGMPVVHGDVYVGRVACVTPDRDQAAVDLVTGRDFFVGARLESLTEGSSPTRPVRMVVGGLTDEGGEAYALALHNPETSQELQGVVRVEEGDSAPELWADQARDFVLGSLAGRNESYWVRPGLDYLHGLFHVVIACPAGEAPVASEPEPDVLEDGHWTGVSVLGHGQPSSLREAIVIDAGSWKGVQDQAAVVFAARLVGRVRQVGRFSSRVSLIGDRGFRVPVLARVNGEEAPRVLGQLVSLGRDPSDGAVMLRWTPVQPIGTDQPGPEALPAQLFTGAGALGVPRGLAIGDTLLPRGPGPHVLRVVQSVDLRWLDRLWVRRIPDPPEDCP